MIFSEQDEGPIEFTLSMATHIYFSLKELCPG